MTVAARDLTALAWCVGEIRESLARAETALEARLSEPSAEAASARSASSWLHQAHGALRFVELDGVAVLMHQAEQLVTQIEHGERVLDADLLAMLVRAFAATVDYLEAVAAGKADSPVVLFSHYRELLVAQGVERIEPADLFVPDLAPMPPSLAGLSHQAIGAQEAERLKAAFERGLLGFLRQAGDAQALKSMHDTAVRMQRAHDVPASQRYWWLAAAFIDALRTGALNADLYTKRQVARLQQHLRRDVSTLAPVTSRMAAELLFLLARSGPGSAEADQARELFGLSGSVPADFEVSRYGLLDARSLRLAREATTDAKAAWERFVRAGTRDLPGFAGSAQQLDVALSRLPMPGMRELGGAISGLRRGLADGDARRVEALSLDVASALLFIELAIEQGAGAASDNDARAMELARRLEAIARDPGAYEQHPPMPAWLSELSRTAQERLTTGAFVAELQVNLKDCERALDAFFRDPQQRDTLQPVGEGLRQVSGALRLLGHHEAAGGADEVAQRVAEFAEAEDVPDAQAFERVAHNLGALGFFVESLRRADTSSGGFSFSHGDTGFTARLTPHGEAPQPPVRTVDESVQVAPPIDTELLDIFLDEAEDVLSAIETQRIVLELAPEDVEALTTIRRGFHTLKGSSRMVGLLAFGEVAWTLEQTLNGWLARGQAPQSEDIALIAQTQRTLQDWVARLRADPPAGAALPPIQLDTAARLNEAGPGTDFELIDLRAAGLGEWMRPVDAAELDPIDLDSIEIIEPVAALESIDTLDLLESGSTADDFDAIDAIEPTLPRADELTVQIGSRTLPDSLYRIFLQEADDSLETLTALHAAWQANPDWSDVAAAREAARAAHSLMGSARLVALPQVDRLAGALEEFLERVAAHPGRPTEEQQRCVAAVLDGLRAVLHQFAAGTDPVSDDILQSRADDLAQGLIEETSVEETTVEICDEIDTDLLGLFAAEADELMPQIGDALQRWRSQPADRTPSVVLMRALHTIKGSARMAGAMRLGQALHEMETRIEAAPLDAPASSALSLIDELIACHDRALALYESIRAGQVPAQDTVASSFIASPVDAQAVAPSGVPSASLSAVDAIPGSQSLVRVRADLLDRLVNEAGEVSIARARLDNELGVIRQSMTELAENVSRLRLQLREIELAADSQIQARHEQVSQTTQTDSAFDPLEFDRYTRFQELTRMLAESVNDVATVHQNALRGLDDAARDLAHQTQVTRELQHDLMRIRMVRFGSIADRLHRVVRQSAAESDHQARLELDGVDTEVDRSVLERMAGPMEHLLRNAVAHGIETAQVRERAGKAPEGVVSVDVRQDGHALVMTFADDGAGLDLDRIRRSALDRGLITPEARLSERELAQLIFLPGFSTASQLSTLAGRGVGLDAVRAEVAAMGGRIELETTPGQGTRFVAHLPVSLAVTQVVVLTAGQTRIAVPSNLVEQVMHLQPDPIAQAYSQHAVTVGDASVPLYYLGSLLELRGARPQAQRQSPIILLRSGSQRIALHVDHVAPSQEVVVKQVGPQLARVTGMAGATVLGNGEIVLILDPVQIAATGRSSTAGQGDTASFAATGIDVVPTVMVVDDSVTVRKVTQRLLAREGYQVVLARDGLDALRQLQDTVPDVMLLDIEMPRMDGFELIGQMRADARWRDVPVIMISSRTAEKHREHAQSLGVLAFLGKPFDEADLLERLQALTTRPVPSV